MTTPERAARIHEAIVAALGGVNPEVGLFWETLTAMSPVFARLGVVGSTIVTRFSRIGLPSPRAYLTGIRHCLAAGLFDDHDYSLASVAYTLGWASPQSFTRHLQSERGITGAEFRETVPYNGELERFLETLVRPHADTWRTFRPLTGTRRPTWRSPIPLETCPTCGLLHPVPRSGLRIA